MKDKVYFLNMFPDYEPPEGSREILSQAAVVAADIDPIRRCVELALHSQNYIPKRLLDPVCRDLQNAYGLRGLRVTVAHPADQLHLVEADELMQMFVSGRRVEMGGGVPDGTSPRKWRECAGGSGACGLSCPA